MLKLKLNSVALVRERTLTCCICWVPWTCHGTFMRLNIYNRL